MKKLAIVFMVLVAMVVAATPVTISRAQTRNQTSKFQVNESFVFPNECTSELMDVTDTTTVTCHDQQRADGTFIEKCEIRQDVTAVGQSTGIIWHGTATFKDQIVTTDPCNFRFTNVGTVRLISAGSSVNTFLNFDELVSIENCALTADEHNVSFECRGNGKP
jgi:hypothetical protein